MWELTRRGLLRLGAASGGAMLMPGGLRRAWADDQPSSPPTLSVEPVDLSDLP